MKKLLLLTLIAAFLFVPVYSEAKAAGGSEQCCKPCKVFPPFSFAPLSEIADNEFKSYDKFGFAPLSEIADNQFKSYAKFGFAPLTEIKGSQIVYFKPFVIGRPVVEVCGCCHTLLTSD